MLLLEHGGDRRSEKAREQGDNSRMARADGGKVGYPAKAMTRMERSLARAQKAIAEQTKPIMDLKDSVVAHALEIAKSK